MLPYVWLERLYTFHVLCVSSWVVVAAQLCDRFLEFQLLAFGVVFDLNWHGTGCIWTDAANDSTLLKVMLYCWAITHMQRHGHATLTCRSDVLWPFTC